jgi:uncharacterized surface protein with fasciclin (FAS1) repeats
MVWRGTLAAVAVLALTGCGSDGEQPPPSPTPATVSGPLCAALPTGDDPGAPASLAGDPADEALTWIPVITTFEAAVRATGLDRTLHASDGVTILAPTDEAFDAAFDRRRLDDLLLSRRGELRELLEAHLIDGEIGLADMLDGGSVTTLDGREHPVEEVDGMARLDGRATTVCADYRVANARIHVIDRVLR